MHRWSGRILAASALTTAVGGLSYIALRGTIGGGVIGIEFALLIGGLLGTFQIFQWLYPLLLRIFLRRKLIFLIFPLLIVIGGAMVWLGVPKLTGWMPDSIRRTKPMMGLAHSFPGLGGQSRPLPPRGNEQSGHSQHLGLR